jgi:hypothetical protein
MKAAITAVAAFLVATPAVLAVAAEAAGPVQLLPPAMAGAEPAAPDVPAASGPPAPALQVEQLAPPDPDGVGLLETGAGGLDATAWSGLPRAAAERLVGGLPAVIPSPAVRDLVRRALLTTAPSPRGKADRSWAGVRLERVAALGLLQAAGDLAATAPAALEDEGAAREWAGTALLIGDPDATCAKVGELTGRFQSAGWQQLVIACQIRSGQSAPALLALDLLREQGGKDDSFLRIADQVAVGGKATPLKSLPDLSPAGLFLARAAKRPLPADALHGAGPAPLAALARSEETALAVRVQAAERAAVLGLFDARDLAQLYKRSGAGEKAALYQLLLKEQDPAGKADLLRRAVALGTPAELAGPYGELLVAELGIIPATSSSQAAAPAAVRLLLLQGRGDLARPWLELTRGTLEGAAVWPLAVAAGLEPIGPGLGAWVTAMTTGEAAHRASAGTVLAVLAALGEAVEPQIRSDTLDAPGPSDAPAAGASPALWYRLEEAAQGRRAGEVALLTGLILGEREPGTAALPAIHCVRQLTRTGLLAEARRLAVETIAGLPTQ